MTGLLTRKADFYLGNTELCPTQHTYVGEQLNWSDINSAAKTLLFIVLGGKHPSSESLWLELLFSLSVSFSHFRFTC